MNVLPLIETGECLSFCSTRPAFALRSVTAIVYLPAFRLVRPLPLYARLRRPAGLTAAVNMPRNGAISEPTRSGYVTPLPLPAVPVGVSPPDGGEPSTTAEVVNVWATLGNASEIHWEVEPGRQVALVVILCAAP